MLTLELITPADDARPVFLAGNFNGWATKDERFRMKKIAEGRYLYAFSEPLPASEPLEYKYIKGGWEGEELDADGHTRMNRRMEVPKGKVTDVVPRWKKHSDWYDPAFYPDIRILSKRFPLTELRRRRRISILLPWDYDASAKRYPVLYLQDGQNLFEDGAPFGTWGVDKQLAALAQKGKGDFIVVAIDHGGKERIKEYAPYDSPKWGEGLGREYAHFLTETLKPYIDEQFRTRPEREHTGIGGSSMGGLISVYAGIMFPKAYSKFMIFSPSLWVTPRVYREPFQFAAFPATKIYLYAGGKEGAGMLSNAERFKETIEKTGAGRVQFRLEIDPEGRHQEARWGQEFPKAAEWLF
ncbi:MAG: alpha/beta hydrolase [Saprospiraceae bacterium]|nr:alpha/beta hydrolase [Saprospiraceae bacterium]